MANLTNTYGYYSEGESFSIADKDEVWVLEMISKGEFEKGTVYVAKRVPEGHITGHSNQMRITTYDKNDEDNYIVAPDVYDFAVKHLNYTGAEEGFSWSDTYCPVDAFAARLSEARTWSNFNFYKNMTPWLDYA